MAVEVIDLISDDEEDIAAWTSITRPQTQSTRQRTLPIDHAAAEESLAQPAARADNGNISHDQNRDPIVLDSSEDESPSKLNSLWRLNDAPKRRRTSLVDHAAAEKSNTQHDAQDGDGNGKLSHNESRDSTNSSEDESPSRLNSIWHLNGAPKQRIRSKSQASETSRSALDPVAKSITRRSKGTSSTQLAEETLFREDARTASYSPSAVDESLENTPSKASENGVALPNAHAPSWAQSILRPRRGQRSRQQSDSGPPQHSRLSRLTSVTQNAQRPTSPASTHGASRSDVTKTTSSRNHATAVSKSRSSGSTTSESDSVSLNRRRRRPNSTRVRTNHSPVPQPLRGVAFDASRGTKRSRISPSHKHGNEITHHAHQADDSAPSDHEDPPATAINKFYNTYTESEKELLYKLKQEGLAWAEIKLQFPNRTVKALQMRYFKIEGKKQREERRDENGQQATTQHVSPQQAPRTSPSPKPSLKSSPKLSPSPSPRTTKETLTQVSDAPAVAQMSFIKGLRRRATGGATKRFSHAVPIIAENALNTHDPVGLVKVRSQPSLLCLQRHRELGTSPSAFRQGSHTKAELRSRTYQTLGPTKYIDDASGDVATVAWSPDGQFFAGGAVVLSDTNSMQYNRPCNLLLGHVNGSIMELPDHHVQRPHTDKGVNSLQSMRETQDLRLFTTIQMVAFAPDSQRLHAVSVDGKLSSYSLGTRAKDVTLEGMYQHDSEVDLLSVSQHTGLVATGERSAKNHSIRILRATGGSPDLQLALSSKNAGGGRSMYPSALKWGTAYHQSSYLLAGFTQEKELLYADQDAIDVEGEACLIDGVSGSRIELSMPRNVFDVAWNPRLGHTAFAIASVGFGKLNHGMKTVVRLFGERMGGIRSFVELECPARDINDVTYSPFDDNLIAAGSTDGKVYIWDVRFTKVNQEPHKIMSHGPCLSVLPHERKRWEADTGIRFLSYGSTHNGLYSGSSDGVVKVWNPYLANEDMHVKDIATFSSAVMSGAFNSDATSLLIGEDRGRLNLLEVGHDDASSADAERFDFIPAPEPPRETEEPLHIRLLKSGQVIYEHCGALPVRQAVQGPMYQPKKQMLTQAEADVHQKAADLQRELFHQRNRWKKTRKACLAHGGPKIKPCNLHCGYMPRGVAGEEVEVSGNAAGRIPDELRRPAKKGLEAAMAGLVALCTSCGDKCLPADDGKGKAMCERCGFGCFRCGMPAELNIRANSVKCSECGLQWDVGVLGYEVSRGNKVMGKKESSFTPPSWGQEFGDDERAAQLDRAARMI